VRLVLFLLLPETALAHDFTPGVLTLEETERKHVYRYAWTPPVDSGTDLPVSVRFDPSCVAGALLECREGLGTIEFPGLSDQRAQVVVAIRDRAGAIDEIIVWGDEPRARPGVGTTGWIRLGMEHVLTGYDHLAFVIGLLLVTGFRRRIILTITAFTAAHSVTLALAALELVRPPGPPVEATIAASVVLVARESTHDQPTITRRFPWVVALIFGLIHGLGFAGALQEIGLPRESVWTALLSFNAGVEAGQLLVVAVALLLTVLASRWKIGTLPVSYSLGALASFWMIERVVAIVSG
jgi:hydrogenase/urease accessory protein HupE